MNRIATYLTDPRATTLRTVVTGSQVRSDGTTELETEDTVFHPEGGGQPADTGEITVVGQAYAVVGVRQEWDGRIWHALGTRETATAGAEVHMLIDWSRRHRLMRTHTAAHLICAIAGEQFGATVTGCEMSELQGRIDFDGLPGGTADALTASLAESVASDGAVRLSWLSAADAASDPDLVRTRTNRVPSHVDRVRVVSIGTIDRQADGGTHVASTSEIGRITVTKVENKGKGNRRVRFEIDD